MDGLADTSLAARPIDLPHCTLAAARAWRRIAPRLPLPFAVNGADHALDLAPPGSPGVPDDWPAVGATLDGQHVSVRLDPALLPEAALSRLPELAELGVPEGLRVLLFDVLLSELSGLVAGWCGARPVPGPARPGTLPHQLIVRRAGRPCAAIALDDAGLGWLADRLLALPPRPLAVDGLPVVLDVVVDRAALTARELRAAGRGDVVLLDETPVDGEGGVAVIVPLPLLAAGIAGLRGRVLGGRLELLSFLDGQMDKPSPPLPAALDDLPLPVEFLIGRLSLPLHRLRELAPGQVLDLGLDVTAAVTLRVNGQVVAEGELVRLAERTGVRITELHLARG